jgi:hypothetical protein
VGIEPLKERHKAEIAGVLGCWDRMLVFGTLLKICCAKGMTSYLYERNVRIFDYIAPKNTGSIKTQKPSATL